MGTLVASIDVIGLAYEHLIWKCNSLMKITERACATEQVVREERLRADRAERSVSERQAAQSGWEQQLTHKDAATAEQVLGTTLCQV